MGRLERMMVDKISQRLEDARYAAKRWADAKPRTARRNEQAARTIEAYVEVDALLANGYPAPAQWGRSVSLPSVEELADALVAVSLGLSGPVDSYPVKAVAQKLHDALARRRAPRVPMEEPARATVVAERLTDRIQAEPWVHEGPQPSFAFTPPPIRPLEAGD